VTKNGQDPLLSEKDNTSDLVQPPSAIEVNHAITAKMRNLLVMVSCNSSYYHTSKLTQNKMKAVKKFKALIERKRNDAQHLSESMGRKLHNFQVSSNDNIVSEPTLHKSKSVDLHERGHTKQALVVDGSHPYAFASNPQLNIKVDPAVTDDVSPAKDTEKNESSTPPKTYSPKPRDESETKLFDLHEKGHAHDPMDEEPLFLGIGTGGSDSPEAPPSDIVAESPTAADFNIYDTAYQQEVERIRAAQGHTATVYLTRRVDTKREYKADENMVDAPQDADVKGKPHEGFKDLLDKAREKKKDHASSDNVDSANRSFFDLASRAVESTKSMGRGLSEKGNAALDSALQRAVEKRKERTERKEAERGV